MSLGREQAGGTLSPAEGRPGQESTKLAFELSSLGLTLSQSRVYLFLLAEGPSPVRTISKDLGLHRVDAYRKVHELEDLALIEQHLDSPKRYLAVSPGDAISALLNKQREREATMKRRAASIAPRLNLMWTRRTRAEPLPVASSYRLGTGRARYHNELKGLVRGAKSEVLRILSADGVIRNVQSGFYSEYFRAASKGINVRMITEVTPANRDTVRRLAKAIKVRYLDGIRLRFTVVDRAVTVFGTSYKPGYKEYTQSSYIVFKDPSFANAFCFFFDHLWEIASPQPPP